MMLGLEVIFLIIILSLIQSLFGVGLLLFGTPLLLLMGYDFHQTLLLLLPASIAISVWQIYQHRRIKLDDSYRRQYLKIVLPAVVLGLLLVSVLDLQLLVKWSVFIMLITSFILRTYKPLAKKLRPFINKNLNLSLFTMGVIHGFSNMGGALLVPIASSLYKSPKQIITVVSFIYALMASSQFLMVLSVKGHLYDSSYLITPIIAITTKTILNRKYQGFKNDHAYQKVINMLILCNSVVLFISLVG
jgi:uncharacterized protein